MTHLLDVDALIALLSASHVHHARAKAFCTGKKLALCPISELGFIRIGSHPAGLNLTMEDARKTLGDFIRDEKPAFVPADARALDGAVATTSGKTTDFYLANLAAAHGLKLATFDGGIKHRAAEVIG